MKTYSRIRVSLVVTTATCLTALALLVPGAPGAPPASGSGECALPGWIHVLTGHWGSGDCR